MPDKAIQSQVDIFMGSALPPLTLLSNPGKGEAGKGEEKNWLAGMVKKYIRKYPAKFMPHDTI